MTEIAVSRLHAIIKNTSYGLYLEDNSSKFGTLIHIPSPLALNPEKAIMTQSGRGVLQFVVKKRWKLFEGCMGKQREFMSNLEDVELMGIRGRSLRDNSMGNNREGDLDLLHIETEFYNEMLLHQPPVQSNSPIPFQIREENSSSSSLSLSSVNSEMNVKRSKDLEEEEKFQWETPHQPPVFLQREERMVGKKLLGNTQSYGHLPHLPNTSYGGNLHLPATQRLPPSPINTMGLTFARFYNPLLRGNITKSNTGDEPICTIQDTNSALPNSRVHNIEKYIHK